MTMTARQWNEAYGIISKSKVFQDYVDTHDTTVTTQVLRELTDMIVATRDGHPCPPMSPLGAAAWADIASTIADLYHK